MIRRNVNDIFLPARVRASYPRKVMRGGYELTFLERCDGVQRQSIDRAAFYMEQALEEMNEYPGAHATSHYHETQLAAWADGLDHVQTEALSCDPYNRSLPFWCPSRSL